jgi:Flp pilus assembly protein TadG
VFAKALARRRRPRGQSLLEFAIILPVLLMLVGGAIQYGMIFATEHNLIQIGRDVGRWAATQDYSPCSQAALSSPPQPATEADQLARQSHLLGYTAGSWVTNFTVYPDNSALPASLPDTEGMEVVWSIDSGGCPPADSTTTAWVTVRLTTRAPVVLPGFAYLPGLGTCDSNGCYVVVKTTAKFRMEPKVGG